MHLSEMNRFIHKSLHNNYFWASWNKILLVPRASSKPGVGRSCSKIKVAPRASAEEILMSTPASANSFNFEESKICCLGKV